MDKNSQSYEKLKLSCKSKLFSFLKISRNSPIFGIFLICSSTSISHCSVNFYLILTLIPSKFNRKFQIEVVFQFVCFPRTFPELDIFAILPFEVVLGNRQNEVEQLHFDNFQKVEAKFYKSRVLAFKLDKQSFM